MKQEAAGQVLLTSSNWKLKCQKDMIDQMTELTDAHEGEVNALKKGHDATFDGAETECASKIAVLDGDLQRAEEKLLQTIAALADSKKETLDKVDEMLKAIKDKDNNHKGEIEEM